MSSKTKIGGYAIKDLGSKIDWEGGLEGFFIHYESPATFCGTPIEQEVQNFISAYRALLAKLDGLGVALEEQ